MFSGYFIGESYKEFLDALDIRRHEHNHILHDDARGAGVGAMWSPFIAMVAWLRYRVDLLYPGNMAAGGDGTGIQATLSVPAQQVVFR